jgi:hypothetical protein
VKVLGLADEACRRPPYEDSACDGRFTRLR